VGEGGGGGGGGGGGSRCKLPGTEYVVYVFVSLRSIIVVDCPN